MVVSAANCASSNSTRPPGGARTSSSTRKRKDESPVTISSPCCSHCSPTPAPFTSVPLRLSRSRTRNLPSCQLTRQCFRETEGSTTAIPFDASRPIVTSPSDRGIVESFKGPESTRSLGRMLPSPRGLLITLRPQMHARIEVVPLSERIVIAIRSDNGWRRAARPGVQEGTPQSDDKHFTRNQLGGPLQFLPYRSSDWHAACII